MVEYWCVKGGGHQVTIDINPTDRNTKASELYCMEPTRRLRYETDLTSLVPHHRQSRVTPHVSQLYCRRSISICWEIDSTYVIDGAPGLPTRNNV